MLGDVAGGLKDIKVALTETNTALGAVLDEVKRTNEDKLDALVGAVAELSAGVHELVDRLRTGA